MSQIERRRTNHANVPGIEYVTPPIHEPANAVISDDSTDNLPAPTTEVLEKFLGRDKEQTETDEDLEKKKKQLKFLLEERKEEGDVGIKCHIILKFLGYKSTNRGSTEKRKMAEKKSDFLIDKYKNYIEGEIYDFPCSKIKQPDPARFAI